MENLEKDIELKKYYNLSSASKGVNKVANERWYWCCFRSFIDSLDREQKILKLHYNNIKLVCNFKDLDENFVYTIANKAEVFVTSDKLIVNLHIKNKRNYDQEKFLKEYIKFLKIQNIKDLTNTQLKLIFNLLHFSYKETIKDKIKAIFMIQNFFKDKLPDSFRLSDIYFNPIRNKWIIYKDFYLDDILDYKIWTDEDKSKINNLKSK